jgi:hypothetical protein
MRLSRDPVVLLVFIEKSSYRIQPALALSVENRGRVPDSNRSVIRSRWHLPHGHELCPRLSR